MSDKMNPNDDELYQNLIKQTKQAYSTSHILTQEDQRAIFNMGKNHARLTNIFISLAVLLLIIPVMTLITYFYYAIGGRADKLIEVASNTIYVTEPNINLEKIKIEDDIGLFSMHVLFDVNKRIGKEDYKAGDYDIYFALDQPNFPKITSLLERPFPKIPSVETETLLHPNAKVPFDTGGEWNILKGLPDGTVAELYVSLSTLHKPEEIEQMMPKETEVRWLAVDTGLEEKQVDKEGVPITAIGYPAQVDSTIWSPFNGREQTNEEVFMDILTQLSKNEEVATKVARAKSLELKERIAFIKKNGIQVYGAVVTGPTSELRKLEQMKEVRAIKVGEVKLWNWK